jgi:hypothetical protein
MLRLSFADSFVEVGKNSLTSTPLFSPSIEHYAQSERQEPNDPHGP